MGAALVETVDREGMDGSAIPLVFRVASRLASVNLNVDPNRSNGLGFAVVGPPFELAAGVAAVEDSAKEGVRELLHGCAAGLLASGDTAVCSRALSCGADSFGFLGGEASRVNGDDAGAEDDVERG